MERSFAIVIVGAGPAGAAAALHLTSCAPDLARRTLLLDAQAFPREKLCGGGLVAESDRFLRHLGVADGFASVPIREIVFEYPGGRSVQRAPSFFRVVHRAEFDAALVREARARGIEFRDGDAVRDLIRDSHGVTLVTRSGACYRAGVVIGADGARSAVRRSLVGGVRGERFVALEVLTPGHDRVTDGLSETAVFDFRLAESGMRGYAWDFPSLREGRPCMNRGLGAAVRSSKSPLRDLLVTALDKRGIEYDAQKIQAAGAPLYDPARPQSSERVLLAGDAVGIDPWFGEGISIALGTGILAANAAVEGLRSGQLGFDGYAKRLEESAVGWSLEQKRRVAEVFYANAQVQGGMGVFLGNDAAVGSTDGGLS